MKKTCIDTLTIDGCRYTNSPNLDIGQFNPNPTFEGESQLSQHYLKFNLQKLVGVLLMHAMELITACCALGNSRDEML